MAKKTRRKAPPGERFSKKTIGQRIDALRADRKIEAKELYGFMNWDKSEYSRKIRGLTTVKPGEAEKIAEYLRAPKGWPYVSAEEGQIIEALGPFATDVMRRLPEILSLVRGGDTKR
jgi:transcriptional regulator with XRE-family HTH domain